MYGIPRATNDADVVDETKARVDPSDQYESPPMAAEPVLAGPMEACPPSLAFCASAGEAATASRTA